MPKYWHSLKQRDISNILDKRSSTKKKNFYHSELFSCLIVRTEDPKQKLEVAFVISSKKVKSSVKRHLIYRLWRSAIIEHKTHGVKILVFANNNTRQAGKTMLKDDIKFWINFISHTKCIHFEQKQ